MISTLVNCISKFMIWGVGVAAFKGLGVQALRIRVSGLGGFGASGFRVEAFSGWVLGWTFAARAPLFGPSISGIVLLLFSGTS